MIRKNVNILAKDLKHDLNKTKDTLLLSSKKKIFRVYTVGGYSGLIDHKLSTKKFQVPLKRLRKGKYVFVVDQLNLKIVFQIHILRNYGGLDAYMNDTEVIVEVQEESPKPAEVKKAVLVVEKPEPVAAVIEESAQEIEKPEREKVLDSKLLVAKSSVQLKKDVTRKIAEVKVVKKANIKPDPVKPEESKSYNLTDLERDNVQSRAEARKALAAAKQQKSGDGSDKKQDK